MIDERQGGGHWSAHGEDVDIDQIVGGLGEECLSAMGSGPSRRRIDPETAVGRIIELVKTRIPKRFGFDPIRDIQVLCPMNRGGAGARSLNIELQAALNPAGDRRVERFGWTFAPGDKVMQIENDYDKDVYNGDIGYVDGVDPDAGEIVASFDRRSVTYGFGELDMLVPAYAATIHKSQARNTRPSSSRCSLSITPCCNGIFFTPASPAANDWSCWSVRKRL